MPCVTLEHCRHYLIGVLIIIVNDGDTIVGSKILILYNCHVHCLVLSLLFQYRILLSARAEIKYSPRAIILLIRMQTVDMKLLDEHLAKVSWIIFFKRILHLCSVHNI